MSNILTQINVPASIGDDLLFQSNAVLPQQLFHERRGSRELEPITRLLYAVLLDAVRCYELNFIMGRRSKNRDFLEAREWAIE